MRWVLMDLSPDEMGMAKRGEAQCCIRAAKKQWHESCSFVQYFVSASLTFQLVGCCSISLAAWGTCCYVHGP